MLNGKRRARQEWDLANDQLSSPSLFALRMRFGLPLGPMSQAVGQTKPNPHRVISPGSALEEFPNRFKISLPQLVLERVGGDRERIAQHLDQFRH